MDRFKPAALVSILNSSGPKLKNIWQNAAIRTVFYTILFLPSAGSLKTKNGPLQHHPHRYKKILIHSLPT